VLLCFCSEVDVDITVYFEGKAVVDDYASIIDFINSTAISLLSNQTINEQPINTDNMRQNLSDQGDCTFML